LASLEPLSDEHFDILIRFAKVFDLTYTRFNDLKQAEAQAREAKIETALERVRSRTMAMQHSSELTEISFLLIKQVLELGIKTWGCAFNIFDEDQPSSTEWFSNDQGYKSTYKIPREGVFLRYYEAAQKGASMHVEEFTGDACIEHYKYLSTLPGLEDEMKIYAEHGVPLPTTQFDNVTYFKYGYLLFVTYEDVPEAHDTFKRFAKVFEQTYTRFLDLQKAEAQARESQIEAALERVRSRTMAMHRSEEIADIVGKIFKELTLLDVALNRVLIWIFKPDKKYFEWWSANPEAESNSETYRVDYNDHPVFLAYFEAWQKKQPLLLYTLGGTLKESWEDHLFRNTELSRLPKAVQDGMRSEGKIFTTSANSDYGLMMAGCLEPFSDEINDIIQRFGRVFQQSYTRYVDVQKAEAQAREAQIEASLERVRSKTMAMHNSQDVGNTVGTFFDELVVLGLEKSARCGIGIFDDPNDMEVWAAMTNIKGELVLSIGRLNMTLHPLLEGVKKAWSNKQQSFSYELQGEDLLNYYNAINGYPDYPIYVDIKTLPDKIIHNSFSFPDGVIFCFTSNSISENFVKVFKRFAGVFGQTYKRYLDLQKAEAQAREAQIEAALERTRTQSMLMQHSAQLDDTLRVFHEQVLLLGIKSAFSFLWLPDEKNDRHIFWAVWAENSSSEQVKKDSTVFKSKAINYPLYRNEPATAQCLVDWKSDQPVHSYHVRPADVENYFAAWKELLDGVEKLKPEYFQGGLYYVEAFMKYGCFGVMIEGEMPEDEKKILGRLAIEFERTYTRFLDLQKAEAQALEATIEASLEKVRGKAMGMHNSNDLTSTASLVFTELRKLGIDSFRSGVGLLSKENRKVKLFSATSSEEGGSLSLVGWAVLDHHPVLSKTYDSWINNEDYFPVLKGESLKSYYEQVVSTFTVPVGHSEGYEQYGYFLPFSEGLFYGWSEKPYTDAEIKILHRFRAIVDLTFRRYMELQKSEENAIEAIRQASLDRVRAEIASMRTTADLDRITPLIWKELNILNIPFVRCGVFIMDELQHQIHTFLSTPEGKAIAAFNLPYDTTGNVGEILTHWLDKKMYISHWDETAFSELGELLVQQGAIPSKEVYMSTVPGGGIHLHCLPFMQGMLYVGNTTQLQESDIHLIQSVADAFSTAYARYEDFNKLESAKAQIEKTLTDLKLTQNQLVQSEKMASLGELTAGIAHEIQNPLNFVNNFSEVSNELLEEMKEEIQKGNYDEVQAITSNIKQNLEKILHHGKRADGIVKGMLQHSRSSSGVKEPTDINALADEYLRLAYHGFRAKDKSFNASTNSDLDKSIGKINVVPQDIGRVVLNLITNAFYAVTEKQKQTGTEYQPTVHLCTKKNDDRVLISVKDNGNGIPKHIREKIFQPFFTTKPTGQGTGLGLSLSYDIVKAHGGELTIETREDEGSEFVVSLPV
jgi:signal transduction histidine kinase